MLTPQAEKILYYINKNADSSHSMPAEKLYRYDKCAENEIQQHCESLQEDGYLKITFSGTFIHSVKLTNAGLNYFSLKEARQKQKNALKKEQFIRDIIIVIITALVSHLGKIIDLFKTILELYNQ